MTSVSRISLSALTGLAGGAAILFNEDGSCQQYTSGVSNAIGAIWPDAIDNMTLTDAMEMCYEFALVDARRDTWMDDIAGVSSFIEEEGFREILGLPNQKYILVKMVEGTHKETIVLFQDISALIEWREGAMAAGWQNKILLQAIEEASIGVLLFDPTVEKRPILFINQVGCIFLGHARSDLLGQDWHPLIPEYQQDEGVITVTRSVEDSERIFSVQSSLRHDLGLVFIADITDLQSKEEQVRHMQRLDSLGHLAGGVAHDFNNILSIINGYGQLLDGWAGDDPKVKPAVTAILNACKRGSGLTTKLLALARRKKVGGAEGCVLNQAIGQIESLLDPLMPKNIKLKFHLPVQSVRIGTSEDHLHQILMNLVVNARDAMPDQGGLIDVVCLFEPENPSGPQVIIHVKDNGAGMAPEIQRRIFEPFFTTKEQGRGTGLGLAVTYGLVQQCQGTIEVHSEVGVGTTFTIRLPAGIEDASHTDDVQKNDNPSSLAGVRTIMIAEDEDDLREPLRLILEQWGMTVLTARHGNDALMQQDDYDGPIHLLLSDMQMPGLFGSELAKLWREVRPETKIILMSGYAKDQDPSAGIAESFMRKPIDFMALKQTIRNVLEPRTEEARHGSRD